MFLKIPVGSHPEVPLEPVDIPLRDEIIEASHENHGLEHMVEDAVQVQRGEGVAALQNKY